MLTLDTQELIELEQVAVQDAVRLAAVQGYCSRLAIRGRKLLSQLTVAFLFSHQPRSLVALWIAFVHGLHTGRSDASLGSEGGGIAGRVKHKNLQRGNAKQEQDKEGRCSMRHDEMLDYALLKRQ